MAVMKGDRRIHLCAALILLNLLFIWGNSLLPGEISGRFSHWVGSVLRLIFPGAEETGQSHHLLRKLAHLTEFACLGFLLGRMFLLLEYRKGATFALSLFFGAAAAGTDEMIQLFIPGRAGSPVDAMIDTFGVFLGVGILLLWKINGRKIKNFLFKNRRKTP